MMKFRMQIRDSRSTWWEEYDKPITDPQTWAKEIIEFFNRTRSPGEPKRTLLAVETLDAKSQAEHTWEKQNLVTILKGGELYDEVKCRVCGMTGKRHGLQETIDLDARFRKAKVFRRCDTALRHLERLAKREKSNKTVEKNPKAPLERATS